MNESLWQRIDVLWENDDEHRPTDQAIATAETVLELLHNKVRPPDSASTGYWPTVVLDWKDTYAELEVFENSIELSDHSLVPAKKNFDCFEFDPDKPEDMQSLLDKLRSLVVA